MLEINHLQAGTWERQPESNLSRERTGRGAIFRFGTGRIIL